ncbi:cysteine rich repeat-containing protein [Acuticoccus kandeliae]|uniref:cysteine rich repeat-containing protein n=1 Tax=Acuticoccus kandeliae TaxID=2073160 RepID=UPI000D3E4DFC|nr:cysteine rich repeat-containing protein [Acuticoccus kandeliae]
MSFEFKRRALMRRSGLAAAMVALMASSAPVFAQSDNQAPKLTRAEGMQIYRACRTDLSRYCPNIAPGGGRIAACMRANHSKLSDGCKATIAEVYTK